MCSFISLWQMYEIWSNVPSFMNIAENGECDASEEKKNYTKKTNKQQTTVKFCGVTFSFSVKFELTWCCMEAQVMASYRTVKYIGLWNKNAYDFILCATSFFHGGAKSTVYGNISSLPGWQFTILQSATWVQAEMQIPECRVKVKQKLVAPSRRWSSHNKLRSSYLNKWLHL